MPSVVKHKIELTLDQLIAVRNVVQHSRDMKTNILTSEVMEREYLLRENGEQEWEQLSVDCALLSDALMAM